MFPWKLALLGIVPIAGFGIGYPIVSKLNSSGGGENKQAVHDKNVCLLVVEGEVEEGDDTKQFLVCKKEEDSKGVIFYLYDRSNKNKQEVTKLKVEDTKDGSLQKRVIFTLLSEEGSGKNKEEKIRLTYDWTNENEIDLKSDCQVDWEGRKLSCSKRGQGARKESNLKEFNDQW